MTTLGQVRGATDRSHRTDFVLSVATSASTYKQPVALAPHLQSTRPSSHISSQPPAPAPAPPSTRNGHSVATFVTPSSSSSSSSSSSLSSTSISPVDANFKAGIKLIQQAYEDKYQALIEEVNTWKWISEEQSAQMAAMAAELARVEDNYAALQKEMAQLEMFRKASGDGPIAYAIISMVDQHSGVSMSQLEQSIMETIEADTENGDKVQDADTSSFMLDDDLAADDASISPTRVN
ncbi:hypothetical protein EDD11_001527 [Mortierella claussenii]|nr:hypothetical protein EDD11_001527 [Mortierella claussenii]